MRRLPFGANLRLEQPARPRTQLRTDDGIPDLVFPYANATVVVEAKTWTNEHLTPGGRHQSEAYGDSVRTRLGVDPAHPVYVVLLSPNGRAPRHEKAFATTYAILADALASVTGEVELPHGVASCLDVLASHFLQMPLRTEGSIARFIEQASEWLEEAERQPETVLGRAKDIEAMKTAFVVDGGEDGDISIQ